MVDCSSCIWGVFCCGLSQLLHLLVGDRHVVEEAVDLNVEVFDGVVVLRLRLYTFSGQHVWREHVRRGGRISVVAKTSVGDEVELH